MDDQLYSFCPICHLPFDEEKNIPRVLPCGHTYCVTCLREQILSVQTPYQVRCILDNQVHQLHIPDIMKLPKNKQVLQSDCLYPSVPCFAEAVMRKKRHEIVEEFLAQNPQEFEDMKAYIRKHIESHARYTHFLVKFGPFIDEGDVVKLVSFIEAYEQIVTQEPKYYKYAQDFTKSRMVHVIANSLKGYEKKLFASYYEDVLVEMEKD